MDTEIMQIISYAGNARALAMRSIRLSRKQKTSDAAMMLEEAEKDLKKAHEAHANILTLFAEDRENFQIDLLMVHGEDYLMSAQTTIDLAKELLAVHQEMQEMRRMILNLKGAVKV